MKHPFAAAGGRPAVFRARIREYERKVLRGGEKDETAESFIREKKELLRPLFELCRQPQADFRELLRAHLQTAESLAADDEKGGAENYGKEMTAKPPPFSFPLFWKTRKLSRSSNKTNTVILLLR